MVYPESILGQIESLAVFIKKYSQGEKSKLDVHNQLLR